MSSRSAEVDANRSDTSSEPILSVRGLKVHFPIAGGGLFSKTIPLKAVDGIDLQLKAV